MCCTETPIVILNSLCNPIICFICFSTDKCNLKRCNNGTMCRVNGDVLPECPCPTECSDIVDPHCSVFLGDYENLCKVHLHACKMQINIGVKHRGRCAGMVNTSHPVHKNEVYFLYTKKLEYVTQNHGHKTHSYNPGQNIMGQL